MMNSFDHKTMFKGKLLLKNENLGDYRNKEPLAVETPLFIEKEEEDKPLGMARLRLAEKIF